jgi:hypothetical protein
MGQESLKLLMAKIVRAADFEAGVLSFLGLRVKEHRDPESEVQFQLADHIPPSSSGKMAFVLSKVPVRLR